MKIIHTADIHLGSKLNSRFPSDVSEKIKRSVENTFSNLAKYASENGVRAVMLSGDVFDRPTPFKKDKDFFYDVVRRYPEVDFLYLRGNHDSGSGYEGAPMKNLKTFSDEWTTYSYDDVDITGIEINEGNALALYSSLSLNPSKNNIVMMHGPIDNPSEKDYVNLKMLANKNINYLALGHIHMGGIGTLDDHGIYVYPGCLEGRGFDEVGVHGFYLLDVDESIKYGFVPFAGREICECTVDVTGANSSFEVSEVIRSKSDFVKNNIYKVKIVGEVELDATIEASTVKENLSDACLYVNVIDMTVPRFDISKFEGDNSLRGEFVREVWQSDEMDEEKKKAVIRCGLKALNGEAIEF